MQILHPGREDGEADRRGPAATRLSGLRGHRVVLLDNSHFNVDGVLACLGERLRREQGVAAVRLRKPNANSGAPRELLDAVAAQADAVVNGIAD